MNETRILAEWVADLELESLPGQVQESVKLFLLDNIGCIIGGATVPWSSTYYNVIRNTRSGHHATVAFFGDKMSPDDAAFLNSTFNHANETDDTHLKSPTHPGGIATPASLALGEYTACSGKDLLLAMIAAYEVQIRISWACSPYLIYRGHHPPVGVGPFGGAAAGAVLMKFDKERTTNAFGIAGSHSAGLIEYTKTGGSVKRIHSAIAAQAGVRAALFAQAGITGPYSILEGDKGFCKTFGGPDVNIDRLTEGLGTKYHLLDNGLKPHSCCHLIHAHLDALDAVRTRADISPDNVKSMTVASNSPQILSHIGSITEPEDILGAQFSLPFSLAMRLHHGGTGVAGGNGFWDYLDVDLKDPALLKTARTVKSVIANTNKWSDVDKGAGLEVELTDGRVIQEVVPFSKGLPENPMTPAEVREKFVSLVEKPLPKGRPQEIIRMVDNITDLKDVKRLIDLLVVERSVALQYAG